MKSSLKNFASNLLLIGTRRSVGAAAISRILIPDKIFTGGLSRLALIIGYPLLALTGRSAFIYVEHTAVRHVLPDRQPASRLGPVSEITRRRGLNLLESKRVS